MSEEKRGAIASLVILGVLMIFIIGFAANSEKIKYDDYIVIANINNKMVKIENPDEYYDIIPSGLNYDFRYNEELDTIDLTIHYAINKENENGKVDSTN